MDNIKINGFRECQQCGVCCKTPCDIIPEDLPPLLERFDTDLSNFFRKYLVALLVASPKYSNWILMMVPVRVSSQGFRNRKLLADQEYLNTQGNCIFLGNNKCTIHDIKPFGGKFLMCPKITGSEEIQLPKSQYFAFWAKNQHLFETIFPGYKSILEELEKIYDRKNYLFETVGKNNEYNELHQQQVNIISNKLFPLFNSGLPIGGFRPLL